MGKRTAGGEKGFAAREEIPIRCYACEEFDLMGKRDLGGKKGSRYMRRSPIRWEKLLEGDNREEGSPGREERKRESEKRGIKNR